MNLNNMYGDEHLKVVQKYFKNEILHFDYKHVQEDF